MTTNSGELRKGVFPPIQPYTFSDPLTEPFWEAARNDKLVMQRCSKCGTYRMPPSPLCWKCQSFGIEWSDLPGTGTIFSYTVTRHPFHPDLAPIVPYVSAIVEVDGTQGEGARLLVNVIDCEPEEVKIGTRVEVVFDHVTDEMAIPRCRPIRHKG